MLINSPFLYQLIKISLFKEPKKAFLKNKNEISGVSDTLARALQIGQLGSFFLLNIEPHVG